MRDPDKNRDHIARLFRLWKDGKINPRVTDTFPLAQGGDAIAKMARREAIGKLVVTND
jgi:NADPH2:quinone reductase